MPGSRWKEGYGNAIWFDQSACSIAQFTNVRGIGVRLHRSAQKSLDALGAHPTPPLVMLDRICCFPLSPGVRMSRQSLMKLVNFKFTRSASFCVGRNAPPGVPTNHHMIAVVLLELDAGIERVD